MLSCFLSAVHLLGFFVSRHCFKSRFLFPLWVKESLGRDQFCLFVWYELSHIITFKKFYFEKVVAYNLKYRNYLKVDY